MKGQVSLYGPGELDTIRLENKLPVEIGEPQELLHPAYVLGVAKWELLGIVQVHGKFLG